MHYINLSLRLAVCSVGFAVFAFHAASFAQADTARLRGYDLDTVSVAALAIGRAGLTTNGLQQTNIRTFLAGSTVAEAVEASGTAMLKSYGRGQLATLSVRGLGAAQTPVTWNGIPINSPALGLTDLGLLPASLFTATSLQHAVSENGAGGTLALSSAAVLNNSNSYTTNIPSVTALLQYAPQVFTNFEAAIPVNLTFLGKRWETRTAVAVQDAPNHYRYALSDAQPNEIQTHSHAATQHIVEDITLPLSTSHRLVASVWYENAQRDLTPTLSQVGTGAGRSAQADAAFRSAFTWHYTPPSIRRSPSTRLTIGYINEHTLYSDTTIALYAPSGFERGYAAFMLTMPTALLPMRARRRAAARAWQARLEVNAQAMLDRAFSSGLTEPHTQPTTDISVREFVVVPHAPVQLMMMMRKEQSGALSPPLEYGVRVEGWQRRRNSTLDTLASPRIHYNWVAEYAARSRLPTLNDRYWIPGGNPALLPERSTTLNAGYDVGNSAGQRVSVTVAVTGYYTRIHNLIQWVPTALGYWQPQNVAAVTAAGGTVKLDTHFANVLNSTSPRHRVALTLHTTYTYTRTTDDRTGLQVAYTPAHQLRAGFDARWHGFYLNNTWQWTSYRYTATDGSAFLPAYTLGSLRGGYVVTLMPLHAGHPPRTVEVFGQCENLTNTRYQTIENRATPLALWSVGMKVGF